MKEQVKKRKKWWIIPIVIVSVVVTLGASACGLLKNTIFMSFPELKGEPEVGSYYSIKPEGALTSNGKQWHGIFKKGMKTKLLFISLVAE